MGGGLGEIGLEVQPAVSCWVYRVIMWCVIYTFDSLESKPGVLFPSFGGFVECIVPFDCCVKGVTHWYLSKHCSHIHIYIYI